MPFFNRNLIPNGLKLFIQAEVFDKTSHWIYPLQKWTEKAKGSTGEGADLKKRKRDDEGNNEADGQVDTDENSAKKKKPSDTSTKLSAFAFNKN